MSRIINRSEVVRVVDSCYPDYYKIFTINSRDGYTVGRSLGLFLSLGITTSFSTMNNVISELKDNFSEEISIAEVESRLVNGKYVNKVIKDSDVKKYSAGTFSNGISLDERSSEELLDSLSKKLLEFEGDREMLLDYSNRIVKLNRAIDKFKQGICNWENYSLQVVNTPTEFRASAQTNKINYMQITEIRDNVEVTVHKRIGILIKYKT